jgi:AcrR family transcriptional regulator
VSPSSPTAAVPEAKRPQRADARRNYDRLVAAARTELREHESGASLEEIARRARVGIGTLYRHFPTRLDLLEAVYREDVEALAAQAETLRDTASPWDGLERWLSSFIDYAATKRALLQELVEAVGRDSELLTHSRQVITESVTTMLTRAQEAGVARSDVQPTDLMRLIGGCTMMGVLETEQRERLLRIVLDGIRR